MFAWRGCEETLSIFHGGLEYLFLTWSSCMSRESVHLGCREPPYGLIDPYHTVAFG